jgi:subtilisin family serine protease
MKCKYYGYFLCIILFSIFAGVFLMTGETSLAQQISSSETRIMACYKSDEVKEDVMYILENHFGKYIKEIEKGNILVYTVPGDSYEHIKEDSELARLVRYIEIDHIVHADYQPDDPGYGFQWNMPMIDVDHTWNTVRGDSTVIVALLDSGIDYTHKDLDANVNESLGWDYVNDDADPWDDYGHGTYTGGVICAVTDNGIGVAGMAQVTLMPMKILDENGDGATSDVVDAIYDAGDAGARVINMSFGNYWVSSAMANACNWAYLTKGIILTAAAGNDGSSSKHYPSAYPNVIGVGAVTSAGDRWIWSNTGDNVELMAPGKDVPSTRIGNRYGTSNGTSMAAPHVAGAAALAFSHRPTITNSQLRNLLHRWANDMEDPGFDSLTGYGLLDCWNGNG